MSLSGEEVGLYLEYDPETAVDLAARLSHL